MQVHSINNQNSQTSFNGYLKINKALREFKMSLNDVQQDIFENNIMRMEKEKDGRVFKFDNLKDGTVGIFEKINHPLAKLWVVLFQAPKEKGTWCFDELNKIYRHIRMARLIDKAEK